MTAKGDSPEDKPTNPSTGSLPQDNLNSDVLILYII